MEEGLFGQLLQQLGIVFDEMGMLVERFISAGGGSTQDRIAAVSIVPVTVARGFGKPHNEEVLTHSKNRMLEALETCFAAQNATVEQLWQSWKFLHCKGF